MNHYADIDEGFEVFDDERERKDAESFFAANPHLTSFVTERGLFTTREVTLIHLIGSLRPGCSKPSHPFDFEEGCLEAKGLPTWVIVPDNPWETTLRWTDFGKTFTFSSPVNDDSIGVLRQ